MCSVDGCEKTLYAKRMCQMHYARVSRYGSVDGRQEPRATPGPAPDPSKPRSRHNPDNPNRLKPRKGRKAKTHCPQGHPYDEENTYYNAANGSPQCRTCRRAIAERHRRKINPEYGRDRTHCLNGHEITPENTMLLAGGHKRCRACVDLSLHKQRMKKYDITSEDYAALLAAQDGRCAICGDVMGGGRNENIDHDHADGHVRGLLCAHCNTGLGKFRDSPDRLRLAIQYLVDDAAKFVVTAS